MFKRSLVVAAILWCSVVVAQVKDCSPIPVAVFKPYDFDAVAAFNDNQGNFLMVWNRVTFVDRFRTDNSPNGRIVSVQGAVSPSRNYSFGSSEGRMADRSLSASYNSNANEFFISWFEIPENGLNHGSGLYFRRIDTLGNPKGPVGKITSHYMFRPRIVYDPNQQGYLLGYGESLDAISVVRLNAEGQLIGTPKSFAGPKNSFNVLETIIPLPGSFESMIFWTKSVPLSQSGRYRSTLMVQRVSLTGDLIGKSQTVIKEGIYSFGNPAVVYNSRRREFLALVPGKEKAPLIQEFQVVRLGPDGRAVEQPHTLGTVDSRWPPAIAFNPISNRYALIYARADDLFFLELGPLGKRIGKEMLMTCTKRSRSLPGLLFDNLSNQFFSYWTHSNPKTSYDIYARYLRNGSIH